MIPKKIHYCWFGENEKPLLVIECIKSWQKYCPDYEIISKNTYNVLQFAKNVEKPNDGTTKQGKELHHE